MVVSEQCLPTRKKIESASAEIIDPLKRVINAANSLLDRGGRENDNHRKRVYVINKEAGRIYHISDVNTTERLEENRYRNYEGREIDYLTTGLFIRGIQLEEDEEGLLRPINRLVCIQTARDPNVVTPENSFSLRNLTVQSLLTLAQDLMNGQIVEREVYFDYSMTLNEKEELDAVGSWLG